MDPNDPGTPAEQASARPAYPRFYLPIVFWLGCLLLGFGLMAQHGSAIVGGALVMAWGVLLAVVAHVAQVARWRTRAERGEDRSG